VEIGRAMRMNATMAPAALIVLAGASACAGPADPPPPADASADPTWRRIGAWNSASSGLADEVSVPGGRRILLRLRCSSSGEPAVRVSGTSFSGDGRFACTGRWMFVPGGFPPNADPRDPGPYRAAISGPGTATSWEIEAYETDPSATG
jgi:hypothetical protein